MPFVRSHGTEIYYESQGEGPAILLAHGGGGNAASWFAQAARANIEQS
jgi:pimeloyl-ACP methyl ester carboxylesterase